MAENPENSENPSMIVNHETVETSDPKGFDRNKLIEQFGSKPIDRDLLERLVKICNLGSYENLHVFLKRGIVFSHRDLNIILDHLEKGEKIYLYTGRGPSTEHMHLGHLVPFLFTKYLQDIFQCELFIQITDDEKFLFKQDHKLEDYYKMALENIKDIIACGFNPDLTYIFIDTDIMSSTKGFYSNTLRIMQKLHYNQLKATFGFKNNDNIGKSFFPAVQMVPSLSSTFYGEKKKKYRCLVPCAIDQDLYFRLVRDVAGKLKEKKPALIHSTFLPSLKGCNIKMSSTQKMKSITTKNTIFLTDGMKKIKQKINRAFSGGQDVVEKHRELGGNPDVDVAVHYLRFFLEDDVKLEEIEKKYRSGEMLTGELKKICFETIKPIVEKHKQLRSEITEDLIQQFMTRK